MTDPRGARSFAEVAPESVLLGGAGAAILLQLADPRVAAGVAAHSAFATDPMRRLWGTLDYVYAVSLGSPRLRAAAAERVGRAHDPVHGPARGADPAYDAHDDDARTWVGMTLAWAGGAAWDAVLGPLPRDVEDAVVRGYAPLATALGVPHGRWFEDRAAFDAAFAERLAGLQVTATARSVAAELLAARAAPAWMRALMPAARLATVALLPAEVRAGFGLTLSPSQDRLFRAAVGGLGVLYPRLPDAVRQAPTWWRLGVAGRRAEAQSRRSEGSSSP